MPGWKERAAAGSWVGAKAVVVAGLLLVAGVIAVELSTPEDEQPIAVSPTPPFQLSSDRATTPLDRQASTESFAQGRTTSETLSVQIHSHDLSPLQELRLWAWDQQGVYKGAPAGEQRFRLPPIAENATILVLAKDHCPQLCDLPTGTGVERQLVLNRGGIVSGQVLVDGTTPNEAIHFELPSGLGRASERIPKGLLESLGDESLWIHSIRASTDSDGRFSIAGLPPSWSGMLELRLAPIWLTFDNPKLDLRGPTDIWLDRPREGLEVRATPRPSLRGKVCWEDGSSVARARITYTVRDATRKDRSISVVTDASGAFHYTLTLSAEHWNGIDMSRVPHPNNIRIVYHHPDAVQPEERTLEEKDLATKQIDVGVLTLQRAARNFHYLVTDQTGRPLPEAQIRLPNRPVPPPADQDGRGVLRDGGQLRDTYLVSAPGHLLSYQTPNGRGTREDPIRFALPRANTVRVELELGSFPEEAVQLELSAQGNPLLPVESSHLAIEGVHIQGMQTAPQSAREMADGTMVLRFDLQRDREVSFASLRPRIPATLFLIDRLGTHLAATSFETPKLGEVEQLSLSIHADATVLHGLVVDPAGAPIVHAKVSIIAPGNGTRQLRTDREGRFQMLCAVPAHKLKVSVGSRPFSSRVEEVSLPLDAPLVVRLEPSRSIEVRVADPQGPLTPDWVGIVDPPPEVETVRTPDSTRLHGLPQGAVPVRMQLDHLSFEQIAPEGTESITFDLPPRVRVRIDLPEILPGNELWLRVWPLNPEPPLVDGARRQIRPNDGVWPASVAAQVVPGTYRVGAQDSSGRTWLHTVTVTDAPGQSLTLFGR